MNRHLTTLKEEIKNRAKIYHAIYSRLSAELGSDRATEILQKAVYDRGADKGKRLADKIGAPDLEKLAHAFVEGKDHLDPFGHQVVEVSATRARLRLNRCPLVEAWDEAGLSAEERRTMCDIANQVDFGKFETAGYSLRFRCRIADGAESCDLHLTK